jgi:hypothetical protein
MVRYSTVDVHQPQRRFIFVGRGQFILLFPDYIASHGRIIHE